MVLWGGNNILYIMGFDWPILLVYLGGAQSCRVQSNSVPTYVLFLQVTFTTSMPATGQKHKPVNTKCQDR